jgi:biopolymer transport protein ExbB
MERMRKWMSAVGVAFVILALPATAMAEEGEGGKPKKTVMELFEATGFVGYLLVGVSVIGTALCIQYGVQLTRERLAPTALAEELEGLMNEGNYDESIELCDANGGYLATLIADGLRLRHAGYELMIGSLEQAAAEEAFKVQARISYLSLLGTVTGMISSVQVIETLKAPTPGDLAKGVYESLVNTTMGLFIAIIFLTAYFFFKNKVTKMTLSVNLQAVDMLKHLAPSEEAKH